MKPILYSVVLAILTSCASDTIVTYHPNGTKAAVFNQGDVMNKTGNQYTELVMPGVIWKQHTLDQDNQQILETIQNTFIAQKIADYMTSQINADEAVSLGSQGVDKAQIGADAATQQAEIAADVSKTEILAQ